MKPLVLFLFLLSFAAAHAAEPTLSASNVQFPAAGIDGAQFNLTFTIGNGNGRIVVVKAGSDISGAPQDGTVYTASTTASDAKFGTIGTEFTGAGEYVVYRGTSSNITVTGLQPGTTYYVGIFEYATGGSPNPDYSVVTPVNKFVTTVVAPTTQATITGTSSIAGSSLRFTYKNGNGGGRIVVARKGATLTATPTAQKLYNYTTSFGSNNGTTYMLDAETFVVYKSTFGSAGQTVNVDITNLEPSTQYTFGVFEYNGTNSPLYLEPAVTQTTTTTAGPTQASGGVNFTTIDGNRLGGYWSQGNGTYSLVVVKKGGPVTGTPVNGVVYDAGAAFETPGTELSPGSGEYVVVNASTTSGTVTNLLKSTTYYFAVFVYDKDALGNPYYLTTIVNRSQSTALPPTVTRSLAVSNITGSTAQLTYGNIAAGNGSSRLLVIREDSPVDFVPEDLVKYAGNTDTYGSGTLVAPGTYTLYGQSNGGAPNVKGMSPGHTYYLASFEMNGTTGPVYRTVAGTATITIPNEPSSAATNPNFPTKEGDELRFDWTPGNGGKRIVIIRKGSAVATLPVDGANYTAATAWAGGTEMGGGLGEYIVYNGSGATVTVTGLDKSSTYHFAVVEYNTTSGGNDYLTAATKWLAASAATHSAPVTQVTALGTSAIQSMQATITFSIGSGNSRLFVMKEGEPVDATPQDLETYSPSSSFGAAASELSGGNYAIAQGNASAFNVSNLKAGTLYHIAAFEFNGVSGPVYAKPAATYSFTTTGGLAAPTTPATTATFGDIEGNGFTLGWTVGNGSNRIVIARKGAAVSFVPVDGTQYSAAAFGAGTDLGSGQYVVYNGAGNGVALTGLTKASSYYFAVYEYNGTGATSKYGTIALTADGATAAAPATKSSAPGATPTPTSMTLTWAKGSGTGRVVVMREGAAVTATPTDLTEYVADPAFGSGPQLASGQYLVYAGTGNSVAITGLAASKTYHFAIYEYSGEDAPVYNTGDFTAHAAGTPSVLPLTWLYVRGKERAGAALLEWATAQETATSHFVVERSAGGRTFEAVATLTAAGNSTTTKTYSYVDGGAKGKCYYRLRQVDADGRYSYSAIVAVAVNSYGISLAQNSVGDRLVVRSNLAARGTAFAIVDGSGRVHGSGVLTGGQKSVLMNGLSSGQYFFVWTTRDGTGGALAFLKR